jgi:hypothetical protein
VIKRYRAWFYKKKNENIIEERLLKRKEVEEKDRVEKMEIRLIQQNETKLIAKSQEQGTQELFPDLKQDSLVESELLKVMR